MPNYDLVVSSKFQPFSFERYILPYQMYEQAYKDVENAYSELSQKADIWLKLANELTDSKAYGIYKDYSDTLKDKANQLAREGLNATSRRDLLDMRSRYSKDIVPIENAYNRRSLLAEELRKLKASDPSLMFDRDFSVTSLNDLLDNPELSYTPVSGNELYKKGKEAAVAASSRMMDISSALRGQYWKIRQGYGADAANKFLLDQSNIPELRDAVDRIVSQSGVTQENMSRAIDYTISGIMSGLNYDEKYQNNRAFEDPLERERLDLAKEQFDFAKEQLEDEQLGAKLPNGNRIKDIGGGRVRIIHPNGEVEIMAAPKSDTNSKDKVGVNKKGVPFSGLQFKMWNNSSATNSFQEGLTNEEWTTKKSGFETDDANLIKFQDLSEAMLNNIKGKLAEYNLTPDDVEIYMDGDWFTDNHYQVRLKSEETKEKETKEKEKTPPRDSSFGKDSLVKSIQDSIKTLSLEEWL